MFIIEWFGGMAFWSFYIIAGFFIGTILFKYLSPDYYKIITGEYKTDVDSEGDRYYTKNNKKEWMFDKYLQYAWIISVYLLWPAVLGGVIVVGVICLILEGIFYCSVWVIKNIAINLISKLDKNLPEITFKKKG